MNLNKSKDLFNEAVNYMPGGVSSPVRSFKNVGGTPPFISKGLGNKIWDVDGNEYMDYVGSWGPLILGHAHPEVNAAIKQAVDKGTSFGAPVEPELELVKLICGSIPSIDKVRLVSSGTEACMSAIRLARAYTNKSKIIKFAGCYHGHVDGLLVRAGSGALTSGIPDSAGVPASYASETLIADFNDLASVEKLFNEHQDQIAGIIVEPIAGNMGVVPPNPGFLEGLRNITKKNNSLLIFDEVITGFRVDFGGAQTLLGVTPDITCLGKIIGGGLPVGAYGSSAEIMECVAPLGPMYQAGTLSGNPLAVTAGLTALRLLSEPGTYNTLDDLGSYAEKGITEVMKEFDIEAKFNRIGSMFTAFFSGKNVSSMTDLEHVDTDRYSQYFHGLLERGVYFAPSQFECGFVSLSHTKDDIDITLEKLREVVKGL
ncbi:MAG: glutamate-1-semialdehyde 2,1-aminomutase [Dehalococcoidia bacterium]